MISHNNDNNANQQATTKIGARTVTTRHYGKIGSYPKRPSVARRPRSPSLASKEKTTRKDTKAGGQGNPHWNTLGTTTSQTHPYPTAEPARCTPSFAGAPPPISGTIAAMSKHETRTPSNRYSDDGIKPNDYEHINDYNDDITWGGYFELHGDMAHILRFIELKCQSGIEWYNENYYELSVAPTTNTNNVEGETSRTTTDTENITSAPGCEQPNTNNPTKEHGTAGTGGDKGKGALRHFCMDAESMNTRFSEQPMIIECLCKDNDAGLSGVSKLMVSIREREVIHNRRDRHMMRHRDLFIPEVVLTDFYEEGDTCVITAQWTALNPRVGTVRDMVEEWMIHGDSSYFTSSYKRQSPDGAFVMYDRCFITWADVENAAREVVSNSTNGTTWGILKDDRFDDDGHIVLYNPYPPNGSALVIANSTRHTGNGDDGICDGGEAVAGTYATTMLDGDTAAAGCTPTVYLVDGHDHPSGTLKSKYGAYHRGKKPKENYRLPDNAVCLPNRPVTYNQFYELVSWWFSMDDTAARAAEMHATAIAKKLDDGKIWTLLPSNA